MKHAILLIAIFGPLLSVASAGDRTCAQPQASYENSEDCERWRPLHKPCCCCLRTWFVTAEPPRVDVVESVALRRIQAPVSSAQLQFQIRAVPNQRSNVQSAVEPACNSGASATAPAATAPDTDCRSANDVEHLKNRMSGLEQSLDRITRQLDAIAKDKSAQKARGGE